MNLDICGANTVAWSVKKSADGWTGTIDLPLGLALQAHGESKVKALHRASTLAAQVLDNPLLASVLPPGVGPALKVLKSKLAQKAAGAGMRALRSWF